MVNNTQDKGDKQGAWPRGDLQSGCGSPHRRRQAAAAAARGRGGRIAAVGSRAPRTTGGCCLLTTLVGVRGGGCGQHKSPSRLIWPWARTAANANRRVQNCNRLLILYFWSKRFFRKHPFGDKELGHV